jgi:hypothetical protein
MLKKTIFTVSFIMLFISATCNKKNPVSADQLFSVKGKILDKLTQWPIDQAIITVADKNDTTDKEGVFAINGLKKSNYIFRISCPSYNTLDTASTVNANTEVIFHLTHSPAALFQVTGHVYNKENSTPLANAIITASSQSDTSAADGSFTLEGIKLGQNHFKVICLSYDALDTTLTVNINMNVNFYLRQTTPLLLQVKGRVYDKENSAALANAIITVADKIDTSTADGAYSINDLLKGEYTFQITCPGYRTRDTSLTVINNAIVNFFLTRKSISWKSLRVENIGISSKWGTSIEHLYFTGSVLNGGYYVRSAIYKYDGSGIAEILDLDGFKTSADEQIELYSIFGFNIDDIWVCGGSWSASSQNGVVLHYDGFVWKRLESDQFSTVLRSIWGSSSTDLWAGGNDGLLLHFDGVNWQKVNVAIPYNYKPWYEIMVGSGNEAYMQGLVMLSTDIMSINYFYFLRLSNGVWEVMDRFSNYDSFKWGRNDFWCSTKGELYSAGGGVFQWNGSAWKELLHNNGDYISGTDDLIFTASQAGMWLCFRGGQWRKIELPVAEAMHFSGVWAADKHLVAYGMVAGDAGLLLHGRFDD